MPSPDRPKLSVSERITAAADRLLAASKSVSLLEVLEGAGFLHFEHLAQWRRGNAFYTCIASHIQLGEPKLRTVMGAFRAWVESRGLKSFPVEHTRRTPTGLEPLQFFPEGMVNEELDALLRLKFLRPDLSEKQEAAEQARAAKPDDLVAIIATADDLKCCECLTGIAQGEFLVMNANQPVCLDCADMGHLEFLPAGNVALTRRAKKHSPLSAVVMQFNRRRKHYERRGMLVTPAALAQAEDECLADAGERAARREVAAAQRVVTDQKLVAEMTGVIRGLFPQCPAATAEEIATHASVRSSGRVGRSAAGQRLDAEAVTLAVIAHIRHLHTDYDSLLMAGCDRQVARQKIRGKVDQVLEKWRA